MLDWDDVFAAFCPESSLYDETNLEGTAVITRSDNLVHFPLTGGKGEEGENE